MERSCAFVESRGIRTTFFRYSLVLVTSHRGSVRITPISATTETATVAQTLSQEPCDLVKAPRPGIRIRGAQDKEVFTGCLGLVTFWDWKSHIARCDDSGI